jgi:hypothetical protein
LKKEIEGGENMNTGEDRKENRDGGGREKRREKEEI